jgi:hypothetical protein
MHARTARRYLPETIDFSDPAFPPGTTAETIHAGLAIAMQQFTARGWESDLGLVAPTTPLVRRWSASGSEEI